MNLHTEAINFRTDLQNLFSSYGEISFSAVVDRFHIFLKNKDKQIEFITLYCYLTKTTLPAWIMPYLYEFLTQEPYASNEATWEFIKKWGNSIRMALLKIDKKIIERRDNLLLEVSKYNSQIEEL